MNRFLICFLVFPLAVFAQDAEVLEEKKEKVSDYLTAEANEALNENNFVGAEADYRRAIATSESNAKAPFNLGNSYYNRESFGEAFGRYKQAGERADEKPVKHKAFHNMGNVYMKTKEYEKAVEAYKEALRNNPNDEETRYNLALAKEMLKKQQQEQPQNNDDQNDENKDKDQENKDQQSQGGDQDQDQENQQKEEENENEGENEKEQNDQGEGEEEKQQQNEQQKDDNAEQKQQPRPNQLSKQQIQNLLEAMQNEEKKVQEKMEAKKIRGAKVKNEKDW